MKTINYQDCKKFTEDFIKFADSDMLKSAAIYTQKAHRETEFVMLVHKLSKAYYEDTYKVLGTDLHNKLRLIVNPVENEYTPKV